MNTLDVDLFYHFIVVALGLMVSLVVIVVAINLLSYLRRRFP